MRAASLLGACGTRSREGREMLDGVRDVAQGYSGPGITCSTWWLLCALTGRATAQENLVGVYSKRPQRKPVGGWQELGSYGNEKYVRGIKVGGGQAAVPQGCSHQHQAGSMVGWVLPPPRGPTGSSAESWHRCRARCPLILRGEGFGERREPRCFWPGILVA